MGEKILDGKGEGKYYIVIYDLRKDKSVNGKSKPSFNIVVYDTEESSLDWNDWIAATAADTEVKAREVMDKFYKEYYPERE